MRGPAIPSVDQLLVLAPLPTTWPLKRITGSASRNRVSSRALRSKK